MPPPPSKALRKRPANLTLAPDRFRFGQRYAQERHTSLSQVVEDLLGALEHALAAQDAHPTSDPLDGLLAGWPAEDKKPLRRAQHEDRLAR